MKKLLFITLCMGVCLYVHAQVNTPAGATWPFGSRIEQYPTNPYDFGIIPSNLPTGTYDPSSNQYGKSQDAYEAYNEWKNCYAYNCGGGQWRIRFDYAGQTVSEGIAYGMLIAAYAADKTLFDGLWTYYRAHSNGRGLMHWKWGNTGDNASSCSGTRTGTDAAADAEVDAAMALIIAECQWPSYTSPYDYATEAEYLISRIRQYEVSTCSPGSNQLTNGDGWWIGCPGTHSCRNPSYQAPANFRHFAGYDSGAPAGFWTTLVNNSYTLINANRNASTGFVSNWSDPNGTANTCGSPAYTDHGYDAIRNPWRMAMDYLWHGETQARDNFTQPISSYIRTQTSTYTNPNNLRGPVSLAGAHIGGRTTTSPDATFTSMWATAAMGVNYSANNQATLDFMYTRTKNVKDALNCTSTSGNSGYFGNTLRIISLFMLTGNFWEPCPPRCEGPDMGEDSISTCGPNSVTLDAGLPTAANRTFEWFKNNVSLGAASSTATTLVVNASSPAPNGPGWFEVKVTETSTGCSRNDSVYVSSTSITPKLGDNIQLCDPMEITLDSRIVGTGYTFTWEHAFSGEYADLDVIPGETNSTLTNVRRPGLYKVTSSKPGCTSKWDTITVTSLLASPQDACTESDPGSVILSVIGPNLGPASNYDWYANATGGTVLSGGSGTHTFNTGNLPAGVYDFFVHDKSRVYGSVGKSEPTSPPANCGSLSLNADGITAGFGVDDYNIYSQTWVVSEAIEIDSVTVWYCLYNNTMPTISFQLTDGSGTNIGSATAARAGVRIVNPTTVYGPPYNGRIQGVRYYVGISITGAGTYRLKASTGSNTPSANMLLEQHPSNIAYNYKDSWDGNTVSITNSIAPSYSATAFTNRYAHFYDWTISKINTCDRIPVYAYIGSCPDVLPVTLLQFTGQLENEVVRLDWQTAMEKDASYFEIERSSDGENYVKIGMVSAYGNSNVVRSYTFTDHEPLSGISYYRLVLVEENGKSTAANVISVEKQVPGIEVFPNPSSGEITVALKGTGERITCLTITDILGKVIYSLNDEFSIRIIDVSELPEGTYIISACHSSGYHAIRFVKKGE